MNIKIYFRQQSDKKSLLSHEETQNNYGTINTESNKKALCSNCKRYQEYASLKQTKINKNQIKIHQ